MKNPKNFIILIGAPGVGKSTWVNQTFNNSDSSYIISSDSIRLELFDSLKQGNTSEGNVATWNLVNKHIKKSMLSSIETIVLDATNLSRKRRIPYYSQAHKYGYRVHAVWFEENYKRLTLRNTSREKSKQVPIHVLKNMFVTLEPPIKNIDCDSYELHFKTPISLSLNNVSSSISWVCKYLGSDTEQLCTKENGKYHKESIINHLKLTSALGAISKYSILEYAGIWHDIGKDFVRDWDSNDNTWTYYNHDVLSSRLFRLACAANSAYTDATESIYKVIRWHMVALKGPISPKVVKREKLTNKQLDMLRIFVKIDGFSRIGREGCETELSNIIK